MMALEEVILAIRARDIEKAVGLYNSIRPDLKKEECEKIIREWMNKPSKKLRVSKMSLGN